MLKIEKHWLRALWEVAQVVKPIARERGNSSDKGLIKVMIRLESRDVNMVQRAMAHGSVEQGKAVVVRKATLQKVA